MKLFPLFVPLIGSLAMAQDFQQTTVWNQNDGGYKTYRIPAAIVTTKGTLLAFCEGRVAGGGDSGEINLLVKRSRDTGKTFGEQSVVWADGKNTCGNPCPVVDESTGTIHLLMTHNLGEDHEKKITHGTAKGTRTIWITSSTDDGVTWSKPREITKAVKKPDWTWYATGPGIGIQIKTGDPKGRLVIPCDYSTKTSGNSHIIYSDDHGESWHIGGEAPREEFNESQVVELSGGRLMLNMRNRRQAIDAAAPRHRGVCISDDGGMTFKDLRRDETLVEPVCQASIIRSGNKLVFSNPASSESRTAMTVRVSEDEGKTWPMWKLVYAGPSAYSCLVALPDASIGLLYEAGENKPYERIDFARLSIDEIQEER